MKPTRSFASDNNAGVHPAVIKAISAVNQGHVVGYGDDPYTGSAVKLFQRHFGKDIEVFFVFNGTAANCLSLKAFTNSYHAVICAESAHICVDACGAPEKFTGFKLIPLPTHDGKLTVEAMHSAYHGIGDQQGVQPASHLRLHTIYFAVIARVELCHRNAWNSRCCGKELLGDGRWSTELKVVPALKGN